MTIEPKEYQPIMLHGWTHLPFELWPDNLPVEHLPWIFRDVAHYRPPRDPTLKKECVFIRQMHDELFITIEHVGVHWLQEREQDWLDQRYPVHPLQRITCTKGGRGPRFIAARDNSEFAIPSVIINIHDGVASAPECEDGPMRFMLAKRARLPYVLCFVLEQHHESGKYLPERMQTYLAPIDPLNVIVSFSPAVWYLEESLNEYCEGKRWDFILERAYLRDGEHCMAYMPDLSAVPLFFRETDYLEKNDDETYILTSGQTVIRRAENEGLEMVLALFRDTLRIESETLKFQNLMHTLQSHRWWDEFYKAKELSEERRQQVAGQEARPQPSPSFLTEADIVAEHSQGRGLPDDSEQE